MARARWSRPNAVDVWRDAPTTLVEGQLPAGDTTWTAAAGPYQVRGQVIVPADAKLTIEPGTSVYFEGEAELLVNGTLVAIGQRPGADSLHQRSRACPTCPTCPVAARTAALERHSFRRFTLDRKHGLPMPTSSTRRTRMARSALTDSTLDVEHVSFRGTHRRMIYGMNASLVVRYSVFPDMFAADENPADLKLDNVAEHIKILGRTPAGGQLIIQGNQFGTNKGHNDVIDADSNRVTQGPILQVLDNVFAGSR